MEASRPLKIVHVLRAPVGGVLRHVSDLAAAQTAAGHAVGIVCDALTGGPFEAKMLDEINTQITLGVTRIAMRRDVSPADMPAFLRVLRQIRLLAPNIIHAHGAKGGVYGRLVSALINRQRPVGCLYAPHGGSLHYSASSLEGRFYFTIERVLERFTDAIVHVSAYEAETYRERVGPPHCRAVVIHNGLRKEEFEPVFPRENARDLLFLGTYRDLKGVDVFLEAMAALASRYNRRASAHLFGQIEGDGLGRYEALACELGLTDRVTFHGPVPAREAFSSARVIAVPSRAESMPYVVLEAIAAGMPIIATRVGGIPEIFGPRAGELIPPGDAGALAVAIEKLLANPVQAQIEAGERLDWLRPRFNIPTMQRRVDQLYHEILATKGDKETACQ